MSYDHLMIVIS